MTKDEIYSKLLDKVQAEGGYLKIEKKMAASSKNRNDSCCGGCYF